MNILGINAFHGDSSACLMVDGELRAAAEEERFRRIKHWAGFPSEAISFCLQGAGLSLSDIDVVAINSDKTAARSQKLRFLLTGQASWALVREKLSVRRKRLSVQEHLEAAFPGETFTGVVEAVEHHECHLASAFFASPFEQAVVVSVDGFGDFCSAAWAVGSGDSISVQQRVYFPHSLGIFYQALTQFLGFYHYGDEYKIMGLAPYGKNTFSRPLQQVLNLEEDGLFTLDTQFFRHHKEPLAYQWDNGSPSVSKLYSPSLVELLGCERQPDQALEQQHKDIAHSVQAAYEQAFFHLLNHAQQETGERHLALAGGCAMNSVANGKVVGATQFEHSYIQAAAGDAGGAIGAAMIAGQRHGANPRSSMRHAYWGPAYSDTQIQAAMDKHQEALSTFSIAHTKRDDAFYQRIVDCLTEGGVVGWFQGAMEWGPRALGNRSILGDPRRTDMKDILNLKIKRRESFRPFAPAILREHVSEWFAQDDDVPFMMKVFPVREDKRELIPAVTHVDGSGRLQTVLREDNPHYYQLIECFYQTTEVPILLNTSFNENEPIVCQPEEAIDCFLRTNMDMLVLENIIIERC